MLTVQPFDPSSLGAIERAIQESDLGQPSNDGRSSACRSRSSRSAARGLVKVARQVAEEAGSPCGTSVVT